MENATRSWRSGVIVIAAIPISPIFLSMDGIIEVNPTEKIFIFLFNLWAITVAISGSTPEGMPSFIYSNGGKLWSVRTTNSFLLQHERRNVTENINAEIIFAITQLQ